MVNNISVGFIPRYTPVKLLVSTLLLSYAAFAQAPDTTKVVTFNPADKEHCTVAVSNGKPLLESTYNGTTVAITMPQNWGNGEFSVLITVAQVGSGEAEINPKEVSGIYHDPDHTRFRWFDKGRELDTQATMRSAGVGQPGGPGDSSAAMPPPNHPEAMGTQDPHAGTRTEEENRQLQLRGTGGDASALPKIDPDHPPVFLKHATLKQGSKIAGYVFIRRPKGAKVEVAPDAMLDEVDIPVNGITFRF
jgi:hypothetical protein